MKKRSDKEKDLEILKKGSREYFDHHPGLRFRAPPRRRYQTPPLRAGRGGHYRVVKNSLAGRAGAGTPHEAILKDLAGPNSIAYTNTDPVALAKALTKLCEGRSAVQV